MPKIIRQIFLFGWPVLLILGLVFFYTQTEGGRNQAGARLYQKHCANCHMDDGTGLKKLIPALTDSKLIERGGQELACLIIQGVPPKPLASYPAGMPAFGQLNPAELRALLKFLDQSWGQGNANLSFAIVEAAVDSCQHTP